MMDFPDSFLNPYEEIKYSKNRLPHWRQEECRTYMITFRLGDSIPQVALDKLEFERRRWLHFNPEPWTIAQGQHYALSFSKPLMDWMDKGHGQCVLKAPSCRKAMESVLMHFEGTKHEHLAWVIMPNHVHTVTKLFEATSPSKISASWKKASTFRMNVLLQRQGGLWQKDYFDTMIRDERHLYNCLSYIRRNPVVARLREGEYSLYESAAAKSILEAY